jgi:hypothetical protein
MIILGKYLEGIFSVKSEHAMLNLKFYDHQVSSLITINISLPSRAKKRISNQVASHVYINK